MKLYVKTSSNVDSWNSIQKDRDLSTSEYMSKYPEAREAGGATSEEMKRMHLLRREQDLRDNEDPDTFHYEVRDRINDPDRSSYDDYDFSDWDELEQFFNNEPDIYDRLESGEAEIINL